VSETVLCKLTELEPDTARKVLFGGHQIALVRIEDDVYAIGDICSHQDVSLSEGYVDSEECLLECGRHGASFNLKTGEPESLPAMRPVPVYEVWVTDGLVHLRVDGDADPQSPNRQTAEKRR